MRYLVTAEEMRRYDQYTIECVSERRHIGSQVFGAIDKSLTTYVFFVEQSIPGTSGNTTSKDFETALASVLPNNQQELPHPEALQ